jgi:hypothetical protein
MRLHRPVWELLGPLRAGVVGDKVIAKKTARRWLQASEAAALEGLSRPSQNCSLVRLCSIRGGSCAPHKINNSVAYPTTDPRRQQNAYNDEDQHDRDDFGP